MIELKAKNSADHGKISYIYNDGTKNSADHGKILYIIYRYMYLYVYFVIKIGYLKEK